MRYLLRRSPAALLLALALLSQPARAQDGELPPPGEERLFGMEFEFAGRGNRIPVFENMPFENYERIMRQIVEFYGGDPSTIRRVDFTKPTSNLERWPSGERPLFRAEWTDQRGRKWKIEPEYVATTGLDGYELVTPPLDSPNELGGLLERLRASGLVREGLKSGVHLTIDARQLVTPSGDARALANLILMHENMEPMLRRMFNPVRGGGHANRFARSLAVDHPDILREIDRLPENQRTRENLEEIFRRRWGREMTLQGAEPLDQVSWSKLWKYRSMNLAKVLQINDAHNGRTGAVEFRMFDLAIDNPEVHRLQAEFYRALIKKAETLAAEGRTVRFQPRAAQPAGEDPSIYNTPEDPNEARARAREMIEFVGLDPARFEPLLERTLTHRAIPTESEFERRFNELNGGRVEHNGKAFTYGFELEGTGEGFALIGRPKDAEVNARWDSMSDAEKKAHYRATVGENRSSVPQHFDLDTQRYPWLDPNWKVEGTGNWEVRSTVFESVDEVIRRMNEIKKLTGTSGKGFHLHMRDNGPDWQRLTSHGSQFADLIERSSNWVWLERARRLGTMTALKSWSNNRFTPSDLDAVANGRSSSRHTVRVTVPSNKDYIDLEIRGFTKYTDDIERLAKIYTEALRTGNYGPWRHTDNVLPNMGNSYSSTNREHRSLDFVENIERYMREVEGKELTPEMRRILEGMQYEYAHRAKGSARTHSTNVATPLLPWESEASIPEPLRRELRFAKEDFLRSLRFTAGRIAGGEYGLDLSVASSEGLIKHLGVTEAEAERLVEYRRAGGKLETAEDVARALAGGADAARASRLGAFDLAEADERALRDRFGLSEEEARRLVEHRNPHDVLDALKNAGVPDAEALRMIDRAAGLDLGSAGATAERMVEVLGVSEETARKIVEFRDAHALGNGDDLVRAGLSPERAGELMSRYGSSMDLSTASIDELRERLGITEEEARRLDNARHTHRIHRYDDLLRSGVAESVRDALRAADGITVEALNTLSAEELASRGGISLEDARKITAYRDGTDIRTEAGLRAVMGERAPELLRLADGIDLTRATARDLERAGLSAEEARRVVEFREPHRVGRGSYEWSSYEPERAARELREAGIIGEEDAERIRRLTGESDLQRAPVERLVDRFGLDAETARRVAAYRDAHTLDRAGLIEAGLSEAEADRVLRDATAIDPRTATLEEIMSRTGLSREAALALLRTAAVDLTRLPAADLVERLGITAEEAEKLVEARQNGNGLRSVEDLKNAGLSEEAANRVHERARGVELASATAEDLRRVGFSAEEAERVLSAREKARSAPTLNYEEISRQVRFKTKEWARETGLSEALLRSLLPRANPAEVTVSTDPTRAGRGFSRTRAGTGPFEASRVSYETAATTFESIRESALARAEARLAGLPASESATVRGNLESGRDALRDLRLEIVETNDVLAEYGNGKVRVSTGLMNEIDSRSATIADPAERAAFRMRALGLVMGHEAAHAAGLGSERLADIEGVRILTGSRLSNVAGVTIPVGEAEVRAAVDAFERPTGASRVDNYLSRLRSAFSRGGEARVSELNRTARGEEVDRLARYRRADGTLDWRRMTRERALHEAGGLAHFGLALFLKELAVVARTGDRARIEEFFDGLVSIDFYKHYGMFVLGARAGEVAYSRYLERYIKPRFVNGILKTNLVLAAGIALPQIVEGTFNGKAFAISLTSLGLSSAAVKAGMSSIRWVYDLAKARRTGTLASLGLRASRYAKVGGWFYTAAELAVVLYFAEDIEHRINGWLDERAAREAMRKAGEEYFAAISAPNATAETIADATDKYHAAWGEYRNFLYRPLAQDEEIFAGRLERVARKAKMASDEREAALERLDRLPALRADVVRRYGSIEAYAEHLTRESEAELARDVETYSTSYNNARDEHLREVYDSNRRDRGYLDGVENLTWAATGARTGAAGDPYGTRTDFFANRGRSAARDEFLDRLGSPSGNRLQAYDDEAAALALAARLLEARGDRDGARAVREFGTLVERTKDMDDRLVHGQDGGFISTIGGNTPLTAPSDTRGMLDNLDGNRGR